jgi:hypothetical protein
MNANRDVFKMKKLLLDAIEKISLTKSARYVLKRDESGVWLASQVFTARIKLISRFEYPDR